MLIDGAIDWRVTVAMRAEERRQAGEAGYFLVEDLLSAEECTAYRQRLEEYISGRRPVPEGMALQREPGEADGEATGAIRKISKVATDDLFRDLIMRPAVVHRMQELMSPNLKLFRADVLMKPAEKGSAKGVHQDSPYWPIVPMDLWSCWLPFDPATEENGCMQVIPGSHHHGPFPHVSVPHDYVIPEDHYAPGDLVTVPMKAGSGLFFHSLLVHGTAENTSSNPRRAITMSYLASEYRYTGKAPQPNYLHISGRR